MGKQSLGSLKRLKTIHVTSECKKIDIPGFIIFMLFSKNTVSTQLLACAQANAIPTAIN